MRSVDTYDGPWHKLFVGPLLAEIGRASHAKLILAVGGPLDYTMHRDKGAVLRVPLMQEPFVTPGPCCTGGESPGPRIGWYRKVSVYVYEGEEES